MTNGSIKASSSLFDLSNTFYKRSRFHPDPAVASNYRFDEIRPQITLLLFTGEGAFCVCKAVCTPDDSQPNYLSSYAQGSVSAAGRLRILFTETSMV